MHFVGQDIVDSKRLVGHAIEAQLAPVGSSLTGSASKDMMWSSLVNLGLTLAIVHYSIGRPKETRILVTIDSDFGEPA